MVIISYGTLRSYFEIHADAEDALNNWYKLTLKADRASFHEMKQMFGSLMLWVMIAMFLIYAGIPIA
jgi:mRNA interferase HigB